MNDRKFAVALVLQLLAATLLLGAIIFWKGEWNWMRWMGLAIGVPSLLLLFLARFQLGKSFAATPQARELVTHGLYSKIRNPMYIFSSLLVLGFVLTVQVWYLFAIVAILIPMQMFRSRQEAKVLEAKFGETYRAYRAQTWF